MQSAAVAVGAIAVGLVPRYGFEMVVSQLITGYPVYCCSSPPGSSLTSDAARQIEGARSFGACLPLSLSTTHRAGLDKTRPAAFSGARKDQAPVRLPACWARLGRCVDDQISPPVGFRLPTGDRARAG